MPAKHHCVSLDGFYPNDEGKRGSWVEKDLIQFFYKKGWMDKYKGLILAKEVLADPAVIFLGLQREGHEEAPCYAGLASCRYSKDGNRPPGPPDMTFTVYIRSDDVLIRWDWEPAENVTYPKGYLEPQQPLQGVLWPNPCLTT